MRDVILNEIAARSFVLLVDRLWSADEAIRTNFHLRNAIKISLGDLGRGDFSMQSFAMPLRLGWHFGNQIFNAGVTLLLVEKRDLPDTTLALSFNFLEGLIFSLLVLFPSRISLFSLITFLAMLYSDRFFVGPRMLRGEEVVLHKVFHHFINAVHLVLIPSEF